MKAALCTLAAICVLALMATVGVLAGTSAPTSAGACGSQPAAAPGVPAGGKYTREQISALWVAHGGPSDDGNGDGIPDDVEAGAIGMAESKGDPNAVNGIGATGLWQIHPGGPQYLDPDANAIAAIDKYREKRNAGLDGFLPWTTYTGADTGPGGGPGPKTFLAYLPSQYQAGSYTPSGTPAPPTAPCSASGNASVQAIEAAATQLGGMHIQYVYGGGHLTPAEPNPGLDCSSSVSWVLQHAGINVPTMVSGAFMSWGDPGPGSEITIYANPVHVFMKIGARFFGTSEFGHPPDTGPAFFVVQPGAAYLAGFVARHPPGL